MQIDALGQLLPPEIGFPTILFVALAGVSVLSAIGVVAFRNPIRSALSLVANFLSLALLYFTLNSEVLGITQIVVYLGAIMVLFLFVLMLLNLGAPNALKESRDLKVVPGLIFAVALFMVVLAQVVLPLQGHVQPQSNDFYGTFMALGRALFTIYLWPFELASILLLVGIVGSILLAKRRV